MNTSSPPRRIVFTEKQKVTIEEFSLPAPDPGEIRVRTEYSLMSTGTENIVFNRLFDPGTHWDQWVKYPFYPGYCAVGTVESDGEQFKAGDKVVLRGGHRSRANVDEKSCFPLPAGIPEDLAPWFALAKIGFQGARAASYKLGDRVMIIGAGPIGQMSLRWAKAAGAASITVVDSVPDRLALATRGGATSVISSPIGEARETILLCNNNRLPNIVVDSTGHPQVLNAALGLTETLGKVVLIGDTGQPGNQSLTFDVVSRGLTIVGAHDCLVTEEWNNRTITQLFFNLVADGRFSLDGLNTHIFRPEDHERAYETANRERAKTMGILFNWKTNS